MNAVEGRSQKYVTLGLIWIELLERWSKSYTELQPLYLCFTLVTTRLVYNVLGFKIGVDAEVELYLRRETVINSYNS